MKKRIDKTQEDIVLYNLLTKGKCSVRDAKNVPQQIYKLKKKLHWTFYKTKIKGIVVYQLSPVQ